MSDREKESPVKRAPRSFAKRLVTETRFERGNGARQFNQDGSTPRKHEASGRIAWPPPEDFEDGD